MRKVGPFDLELARLGFGSGAGRTSFANATVVKGPVVPVTNLQAYAW